MILRYLGRLVQILIGGAMIAAVAGVAILIYSAFDFGQPVSTDPNASLVAFTVQEGDTLKPVSQRLEDQKLIRSAWWMENVARFGGKAGAIKAGTYQLKPSMGYDKILTVISTAPPFAQKSFLVREGERIEEIAATLKKAGLITDESRFTALAKNASQDDYGYLWLAGRGIRDNKGNFTANNSLEGFLFPAKYDISVQPTSTIELDGKQVTPTPTADQQNMEQTILKKMLATMDSKLTEGNILTDTQKNGHSLYDTLVIASIVEREAQVEDERPHIAAVYWNRLIKSADHLLAADPTVQYAQGSPSAWWPKIADLAAKGPLGDQGDMGGYNTYAVKGLPPGPIANPGLASLKAAANPLASEDQFFVATCDGDGRHDFSKTYAEHLKKVAKYSTCNQ